MSASCPATTARLVTTAASQATLHGGVRTRGWKTGVSSTRRERSTGVVSIVVKWATSRRTAPNRRGTRPVTTVGMKGTLQGIVRSLGRGQQQQQPILLRLSKQMSEHCICCVFNRGNGCMNSKLQRTVIRGLLFRVSSVVTMISSSFSQRTLSTRLQFH